MNYKLTLTLKYRINEIRPEDEDDLTEITSDDVRNVYNALETLGYRVWDSWEEDDDDVRFCDLYYILNEETIEALRKLVNLDCVEIEETDF